MRRRPLLTYIGLAYLWTWVTALPLLLQKRGLVDLGLAGGWEDAGEVIGAFGPLLAAVFVIRRTEGPAALQAFWRCLGHWRVGAGGLALALLTPVAFLLLAALLVLLQSGALPPLADLAGGRLGSLRAVLDLLLAGSILQALGEEPGWRGYLQPKLLERFRPLPATLLLFPVWWLWHLPSFLGRPDFGWPQFLGFGLGILSAAVWLTFLWQRTRSILVAVLWHAALNLTRGVALGFSTRLFLAYGMVVALGALGILAWWLVPARRRPLVEPIT